MDYKEKYEQALEVAQRFYNNSVAITKKGLEDIFPELAGSEGERIRKDIMHHIEFEYNHNTIPHQRAELWIAWLEKHKPVEHLELKARHWYICHRAYCCRADHLTIKEGERFMCEKDGIAKGFVIKEPEKYFKEVCPPAPMDDEQKSADKVEPKFHEDDWVIGRATENEPRQIAEITEEGYKTTYGGWIGFSFEEDMRLWTIQDAKAGDMLSYDDGHGNDCIELIKSITGKKIEFWFCLTNGNSYEVFDGIIPYTNLVSREDATPATKEQRNLLFQKIKEAGYMWDAEKKELKKIEPKFKVGDVIRFKGSAAEYTIKRVTDTTYYTNGWSYDIERCEEDYELVEQKSAWSEEDKMMLQYAIEHFERQKRNCIEGGGRKKSMQEFIDWLKSLKDRVQTKPKKEWSKEDRRHIQKLILNVNAKECPDEVDWLISLHEKIAPPYWDKEDEEMLNQAIQEVEYALNDKNIAFSGREPVLLWLKHLRPQSQWKPSKEQMDALKDVIENHVYDCRLEELLEQLKKLREE